MKESYLIVTHSSTYNSSTKARRNTDTNPANHTTNQKVPQHALLPISDHEISQNDGIEDNYTYLGP